MLYKKSHPILSVITFLLFFAVIILGSVKELSLTVKGITPFVLLPLLTAYSVFGNVKKAALAGFLAGADSVASGTYCFNTIALLLIGAVVCLAANNLFNKNIRAATVLSLFTAVIYFFFHWIFFHAFGSTTQSSLEYLLSYSLPSAIYTSVFIFPFYLIFNFFNKLRNQ